MDHFYIQQTNSLDIQGAATHWVTAAQGLPACKFDAISFKVRTESLDYFQFDCRNSPWPNYLRMDTWCNSGTQFLDIYQDGTSDVYNAYCAGGGEIIGQCYWRCSSVPCTTFVSGGVNVKMLDCYFDPCQCA